MRIRILFLIVLAAFIVVLGEPLMEMAVFRCQVEKEALYFPVELGLSGGEAVGFEDSFGDARSFGGDRTHEGCDIMAGDCPAGYLPVISVSDGTIENIGWLKLGGYRIGIRSRGGIYYYYAHLDSYANGLALGEQVQAGQLLGYMGDSGYGAEGTRGQFPVHLHFGIYTGAAEKSQNPYWLLKKLWEKEASANSATGGLGWKFNYGERF